VQQRAAEPAHPAVVQLVDRVSVALAPTLSLHIRLDLESAALQDTDMDAPRAELAGEGDAGRAGADHAHVSAYVLAIGLDRVPVHRVSLRRHQDLPILIPPTPGLTGLDGLGPWALPTSTNIGATTADLDTSRPDFYHRAGFARAVAL